MIRVDAFQPKRLLDVAAEVKRLQRNLDAVAKRTQNRLRINTASWTKRPTFAIDRTGPFERTISTDSLVFHFQDGGTKAHKIRPRAGGWLKFFSKRRGHFVTTKEVNHPGTVAANWTKKAARQAERDFATLMMKD